MHSYKYPRAALTVDCVVFGLDLEEENLKVLLIQRDMEPYAGKWALPGGFVNINETLDDAALRELTEETGMHDLYLEQLYTFSEIDRDPRERVVSVAYFALVKLQNHSLKADTDARDVAWFAIQDIPKLAFDHEKILDAALKRLRGKVTYHPVGFELLPEKFTLTQLQLLYEIILERKLDKRNFRKKIIALGLLEELDEIEKDVAHRAARLYRFDRTGYEKMSEEGFSFSI